MEFASCFSPIHFYHSYNVYHSQNVLLHVKKKNDPIVYSFLKQIILNIPRQTLWSLLTIPLKISENDKRFGKERAVFIDEMTNGLEIVR